MRSQRLRLDLTAEMHCRLWHIVPSAKHAGLVLMNHGDEIAEAYLRYFAAKRNEDAWAFKQVDEMVGRDPDGGWSITLLLVNQASSNEELAYVAAGPLENLLKKHGLAVMDRIEEEACRNDRLRLALSGIWLRHDDPMRQRWYALMWKYGFAEGRRIPL
jgi:hypothetical protein